MLEKCWYKIWENSGWPSSFSVLVVSSLLRRNEDNPPWRARIEGIKVRALNRWRHERRGRREGARRILCQTALNTRDTGRVHSNASTQHSRDRLANKDRHFDPLTSRRVSDRCITFRPHAFTRYAEHLRRFDCFFFDMLIAFTFQRFSTWIINRALISCETFFFGNFWMEYFSRDTMTLKTKRVKEA